MPKLPVETGGDAAIPGEAYLAETPLLASHRGTQPDLFLRWNAVPLAVDAIDVVVFLHGFSQRGGEMPLAEKAARSGLELSGRPRPTLVLLPRGNWLERSWYDFPALHNGGLDRLVQYGLQRFGETLPGARQLQAARLVLAAHSGGGMPAIDALAGAKSPPDEFFVFDGLYGRDPSSDDPLRGIEAIDAWLGDRLALEPQRPGALRIIYLERQTGPFSREVEKRLRRRLAGFDPALAGELARRYKVEVSGVPHAVIAYRCLPELLAQPDAEFDWFA